MFDSVSALSFVIQQERRLISGFLIVLEEEEPSHGYLTSTQKWTVNCLRFSQQMQNLILVENPVVIVYLNNIFRCRFIFFLYLFYDSLPCPARRKLMWSTSLCPPHPPLRLLFSCLQADSSATWPRLWRTLFC